MTRVSTSKIKREKGDELYAVKGKGKGGFKGTCFKCGMRGHKADRCGMRGHKADRSWQEGKGKGGKGDWETGQGGSKGMGWPKGKWSNSGYTWDNSWHSSNWHGKTNGLEVDAWAAVENVPHLCAVCLNPSDEEFSEPKRVSRERQTQILPCTEDSTHVNRLSSLAQGHNELSCENCTSVHTSKQVR